MTGLPIEDKAAAREGISTAGKPGARRSIGWVAVPFLIFAAIAAMFAFALTSGDPRKLPSALIGRPVPATGFAALEGLMEQGQPVPGFTSADLARGKVTVVNFWASWCTECIVEHPLLKDLSARAGVDIYGVNYKDQTAAARRYLGRYGNPYAAVGVDGSGRNAIEWGVYGMPETFVIDGAGKIAFKHVGPISAESIEKSLIPAIEKARAEKAPSS
jgi:cytochrome c biogenesis protein CcmG/thiol:disulfide interchange protein DsbE